MPTSVPNFYFLAPLVNEIWRESQNKNWKPLISSHAYWSHHTPTGGQLFTCCHNTCKNLSTKFQLSRPISFRDMRGSPNKTWELLNSPDVPLRDIFLYRALVCVNAYKCAKFQLPGSIRYWDMEGVPI